ncbi:MAG: hypothetical protein NC088_12950, partial [Bacteroides sp.]|nr:hypothetical protein [Bacteroides sp.]
GINIGREQGRSEGIDIGREQGRSEGIDIGREQGRSEGIDIGREQGRSEGIMTTIATTISLLKENGFSNDKITEALINNFALSPDDAQKYLAQTCK